SNEFGFESRNPKVGTGRPRTFEPAIRERIVAIALAPPTTVGEPLTHWSLRRLKAYLERRQSRAEHLDRDAALHAAREERHLSADPLVETQHRSRVRGEGDSHHGPVPHVSARWRGGVLRRVRPNFAPALPWPL